MVDDVRLYSMIICPFAQRTRIHLEEKGIRFELENLDICKPRPDWFLKLNPSGQVPVLVCGDDVVADSSIVSEYIEERFDNPLPFGRTPAHRARIRALVHYIDSTFIPSLYMLMAAQTPEDRKQRMERALSTWRWLDEFLGGEQVGDGFVDGDFGLAEISIAPFLLRYEVVAYYQDFDIPDTKEFRRVRAWRDRILDRSVVRGTAESPTDLIKLYEDYTLGYFNGAVPPGRERSSSDLSIALDQRPLPERAASVR